MSRGLIPSRRSSLRSPRTLAVLAVAALTAAWGPSANLLRIAHSPADGNGHPAEVRLVLQAGLAQAPALPVVQRLALPRTDAPRSSQPPALLLAISFDGEPPAAPHLSAGARDDLSLRSPREPSGGSALRCLSAGQDQPQDLEAGPGLDLPSLAQANGAWGAHAPRGPPPL